jgi:hypothetical protein
LNNYDITGRKLRIEYKRKVKEASVPENDDGKAVLDQMNSFKLNGTVAELAFPASSSFQRKQIHQFAEKFGFSHYTTSTSTDNVSYVIVKKKDKKDGSGDEMIYSSSPKGQPIAVKAVVRFLNFFNIYYHSNNQGLEETVYRKLTLSSQA